MAVGDSFPVLVAFTLGEAYLLQRTVFADDAFRTVVVYAFGLNILLKGIYSLVIWPFFLNPLRHLPMVPVGTTQPDPTDTRLTPLLGHVEPCPNHLRLAARSSAAALDEDNPQ